MMKGRDSSSVTLSHLVATEQMMFNLFPHGFEDHCDCQYGDYFASRSCCQTAHGNSNI